jgi:TolB protein
MNANGSGLRNLTNSCRGEAWPSWSPDGNEIVFVSDRGSTTHFAWDVWKIPSVGGAATRLTNTGKETNPVWR